MGEGIKPILRIYREDSSGNFRDDEFEFDAEDYFGGFIPCVGDEIVSPLLIGSKSDNTYSNREILRVVRRIFNPRDLKGEYIALVVEGRPANRSDLDLV